MKCLRVGYSGNTRETHSLTFQEINKSETYRYRGQELNLMIIKKKNAPVYAPDTMLLGHDWAVGILVRFLVNHTAFSMNRKCNQNKKKYYKYTAGTHMAFKCVLIPYKVAFGAISIAVLNYESIANISSVALV